MQLLSVNVSLPKLFTTDGLTVKTGIFKRPVPGTVVVRELNLDGDRQADLTVHGGPDKAVYVYSWKNVEFWRQALDRADLGPGRFGENLSVDDLLDDEVLIGDQLEIGTALFEVTQPRIPCYKLGIALGRPDFPKKFHHENRHGFYLRVLREGTLQTGDPIHKISLPESITIADMVEIYRRRTATQQALHRISSLHALPDTWKSWLAVKVKVLE